MSKTSPEETAVLLLLVALVALCALLVRSARAAGRGVAKARHRRSVARKHDRIIAKFRAECVALGIKVD